MNLPTMTARLADVSPEDDHWNGEGTHWRCTLNYNGQRITVPYGMGPAHNGREPEALEVLGCLFSDASCAESTRDHKDFCAEFGYSEDSIKGLQAYKACQSIAIRLRKLLGADYEALQNYCQEQGV